MEKEQKPRRRFEMIDVATQFGIAFKDNETEDVMDFNQFLVRIANDLQDIKKAVS